MGKINSKQVVIDGHTFDSKTEGEYYLYLQSLPNVKAIILQPQYTLLEPFTVVCNKCNGKGKVPSEKTERLILCRTCEGTGKRKRQGWNYTADFEVHYTDWTPDEVIDVKGHANERFPLVKKMFEYTTGLPLIVVQKKKGEWVRK